ncbi:MAG: type II secretion system F family protein [Firmicutes bacterium]|nr:type II secretion system F family protein [Bacillota bacterium]
MVWLLAAFCGGCLVLVTLWYGEMESGYLIRQQLGSEIPFEGTQLELLTLVLREAVETCGEVLWRRLASSTMGQASRQRLTAAGHAANMTIQELWGWRLVLALGGVGYIYIFRGGAGLACLGGYLFSRLPYLWLASVARKRETAIRQALPGILDLLVICTGAGLTFDAAVAIMVEKSDSNPLIDEFMQVLHHMKMGDSRQEALRRMSARCRQPDVRSVCATLIQADQLGTSISSTLMLLANQIRINQAHRAEARANQAPVKLLFPLIFFIFPSLLVVLFGPVFLGGTF